MNLDRRLLSLALQSRRLLVLVVGLGFIGGLLVVLQAGILSTVLQRVFLDHFDLNHVANLLFVLLGVILLRVILLWGSEVSAHALAIRIKTSLRTALFRHLLHLGPLYAREERAGTLTSLMIEGVEGLEAYFSHYLPELVLAVLVPLATLVFIFPLDPLSGLVLLITAPLIPIFMILIGNLAQTLTRRQWQSLNRMSAFFLDVLQGLTTLKALGQSRPQTENIEKVSERFRHVTMSVLRVTFLSALVLEMVATLSTAVVAVEIGLRLLYGRLLFEQAMFILLLAPEFYLPLRTLGVRFHAGISGVDVARRIFEVLETVPPGASLLACETRDLATDEEGLGVNPTICFENVQFNYAIERQALRGVSFQILAKQRTALVGPSGAGKSTIANLLLRFAEPQGGTIKVNGIPMRKLAPETWRKRIAWVPQSPYLFNDSIEANLRLARPYANWEEIIQAAKLAHAHEFIMAMPQGYDTVIGERGARLSGGQAQRLALGRAFLKDAPMLLLDEATGGLDPENEALLQESLDRLLADRTALVIAHRMNTVSCADQILVMNAGRIIESGSHHGLLQRSRLYQRLVRTGSEHNDLHFPPRDEFITANQAFEHGEDLPSLSPSSDVYPSLTEPVQSIPPYVRQTLSNLRGLFGLVRPFVIWISLSVLFGFATVGSGMGLMAASAYIISRAALRPSIADLQTAIVAVRFFGISRGVFRYLERYISHQTTFRILSRMRVWFYRAIEPLAPARMLRYRSGDLLARLVSDIQILESFYLRALAPPLVAALVSIMAYLILASFSPWLGLALLAFHIFAGLCIPLIVHLLSRSPGRQVVIARAKCYADIIDGIQGMAELLAFNQSKAYLRRIQEGDQKFANAQRRIAWVSAAGTAIGNLTAHLGMWTMLILSISMVRAGEFGGEYLAVLALVALTSFEAIMLLPSAAQHLAANSQAAGRLFEIVETQPEVSDPIDPHPWSGEADLEVSHLRFRYPPSLDQNQVAGDTNGSYDQVAPWVLEDVSFNLPTGKRLAIVGASGAGKSTIVHLLLRFWEYEFGDIRLGGQDLRSLSQDDMREKMGVVSQNDYLFNASIRDNLRLACPQADSSEIAQAAQKAQIHEFICTLPEGYDTWIGEGGWRLSAGQRQRLVIARALLKNPLLLILDEPTANLDPVTEVQVLSALVNLMEDRSTLMVTHRLIGMHLMDEILILQAGRVVERGGHQDLLRAGGTYRLMWDLQRQFLTE